MGLLPIFSSDEEEDDEHDCGHHHYGEYSPQEEFKIERSYFYWSRENDENFGFCNAPPHSVQWKKPYKIMRKYTRRCQHENCWESESKWVMEGLCHRDELMEVGVDSAEEYGEEYRPEDDE